MITKHCTPPTPADRLSAWAAKFYRLPAEQRTRWHPRYGQRHPVLLLTHEKERAA